MRERGAHLSSRSHKAGGGGVANWGRIRTNLKKSYDAAWAADGPA